MMTDGRIEGYSTHQVVLVCAACRTTGPIWELGAGHYSTPLLHAISGGRREIVTLEATAAWLERFRPFSAPWHRLELVSDWAAALRDLRGRAGLCFVDLSPARARGAAIRQLRSAANVFVCHDSQEGAATWGGELDRFRFSLEDRRCLPYTRAVSDVIDVREWQTEIPGSA